MARGKGRPEAFGDRIQRIERYAKSIGQTKAELADKLGISPSTLRRWEGLKDRPPGAFGDVGDRITRRERYIERERPRRLEPVIDAPPVIDFTAIPRTEPVLPGDLLLAADPSGQSTTPFAFAGGTGSTDAFSGFDPARNPEIRAAVEAGKRITFYAGVQGDPFAEAPRIHPLTFTPQNMTISELRRSYYRSLRSLVADVGSDNSITLAAVVAG